MARLKTNPYQLRVNPLWTSSQVSIWSVGVLNDLRDCQSESECNRQQLRSSNHIRRALLRQSRNFHLIAGQIETLLHRMARHAPSRVNWSMVADHWWRGGGDQSNWMYVICVEFVSVSDGQSFTQRCLWSVRTNPTLVLVVNGFVDGLELMVGPQVGIVLLSAPKSSKWIPVSVQLTLNQLMLSAKQSQTMVSRPANPMTTKGFQSEDKCFSCSMKWHSSAIRCNFCERFVCDECSLRCFRCWFAFCRLCAVKSYDSAHEDNLGVCLTCDWRRPQSSHH